MSRLVCDDCRTLTLVVDHFTCCANDEPENNDGDERYRLQVYLSHESSCNNSNQFALKPMLTN